MINRELLQETLARVEQEQAKGEESLLSQEVWCIATECGTAFCFAGWMVKLFAEKYPERVDMHYVAFADRVILDGKSVHLKDAAVFLGGLSEVQAAPLFKPGLQLEDLRTALRAIFAREDELAEKKGEPS